MAIQSIVYPFEKQNDLTGAKNDNVPINISTNKHTTERINGLSTDGTNYGDMRLNLNTQQLNRFI